MKVAVSFRLRRVRSLELKGEIQKSRPKNDDEFAKIAPDSRGIDRARFQPSSQRVHESPVGESAGNHCSHNKDTCPG
jgi:hypothetical protein